MSGSSRVLVSGHDRVVFEAMNTTRAVQTSAEIGYALPLVIAVTGHRDLVATETPAIRQSVADFLIDMRGRYPTRRLRVMSSLAEGADQLVAEVAIELGIELVVPLPMRKSEYLDDFEGEKSRALFESLCASAKEVYELPATERVEPNGVASGAVARSLQYAQLGVFLCAHCHILLAIWDGKHGKQTGGTAQVVKFHHDDIMSGYTAKGVAAQQMLVDDESDLVYHIVCSRDRPDGEPLEGLSPLDAFWFTKDRDRPRSVELPAQHRLVFERSAEFSRDAARFADKIERQKFPLHAAARSKDLPAGAEDINRLFCVADCLAIHYQNHTLRTLRLSHLMAFLMGLMFILYADVTEQRIYMVAFLVFFGFAAAAQHVAKRRGWHRKYLDYRTLAEGLRVQFYWAVAGVRHESHSKFAHDSFLATQDPELGWIRNVMRVAGTRCDVRPNRDEAGLEFVIKEWIGGEQSGQLGYFTSKLADRIGRNRRTERLGLISLLTSAGAVVALVAGGALLPVKWSDSLVALMGATLLLYGIRQGYAFATAEKDLARQYDFMLRIFANASRRLDVADDPDEKRQILLALGGSALDEHAEWILMHRERSIDESEVWRMGS